MGIEAGSQAEKTPGRNSRAWTILEKLGTVALGTFLTTLLGIVLGFGGIISKHDSILDVLTEKRPSGMTPSQQMQYNTIRLDAALAHVGDIKITDAEIISLVNDNREEIREEIRKLDSKLIVLKERCESFMKRSL